MVLGWDLAGSIIVDISLYLMAVTQQWTMQSKSTKLPHSNLTYRENNQNTTKVSMLHKNGTNTGTNSCRPLAACRMATVCVATASMGESKGMYLSICVMRSACSIGRPNSRPPSVFNKGANSSSNLMVKISSQIGNEICSDAVEKLKLPSGSVRS